MSGTSSENDEVVLLTVKQYALLKNRDTRTIHRWIKAKKIKASQIAPKHPWEIEITKREHERLKSAKRNRRTS